MAEAATTGATSPFEQAARLERYLRTSFSLRDEPMSGHSYGPVGRELLWDAEAAASPEQFAATFASSGAASVCPLGSSSGSDRAKRSAPAFTRCAPTTSASGGGSVRVVSGWVPFDPTPGAENTLAEPEEATIAASASEIRTKLPPPNDVVLPDPGRTRATARRTTSGPQAP